MWPLVTFCFPCCGFVNLLVQTTQEVGIGVGGLLFGEPFSPVFWLGG